MQLNEAWKFCLEMWDFVFDLSGDINENKANWMEENGFEGILNNCFFCQFAHDEYLKEENHGHMCDFCPAVLIDSKFDCNKVEYDYRHHPKEFKRRLHQLNKQRIGS